jgi:hypothetical protein
MNCLSLNCNCGKNCILTESKDNPECVSYNCDIINALLTSKNQSKCYKKCQNSLLKQCDDDVVLTPLFMCFANMYGCLGDKRLSSKCKNLLNMMMHKDNNAYDCMGDYKEHIESKSGSRDCLCKENNKAFFEKDWENLCHIHKNIIQSKKHMR